MTQTPEQTNPPKPIAKIGDILVINGYYDSSQKLFTVPPSQWEVKFANYNPNLGWKYYSGSFDYVLAINILYKL